MEKAADRRRFLKFLAASPLLAQGTSPWGSAFAEVTADDRDAPERALIASPNDASTTCCSTRRAALPMGM
jgi:hypothetical protein